MEKESECEEICPNCKVKGSYDWYNCVNCWYVNWCNEDQRLYSSDLLKKHPIHWTVKDILNLEKKILKISHKNYNSYEVEIINWKAVSVKFYFTDIWSKKQNFEVIVEDYLKNEYRISNISLWKIWKKIKVWREYKEKINYYKHLWISFDELIDFIKKVLEAYHNI